MSKPSGNINSRGKQYEKGRGGHVSKCFSATLDKVPIENLIVIAEKQALRYKNNIKANQIRNFYGAVNKLKILYDRDRNDSQLKEQLVLLLPQLAYAGGRNSKTKPFTKCMDEAVRSTLEAGDLKKAIKHFFVFVESIVAYHKFYGDK